MRNNKVETGSWNKSGQRCMVQFCRKIEKVREMDINESGLKQDEHA